MENLMSNEEILEEIRKYSNPNYMWLEIWDISSYEIQLVLTICESKTCELGNHKVLRLSSLFFMDDISVDEIKRRGREVKKFLKKHFKCSKILSNLHYAL